MGCLAPDHNSIHPGTIVHLGSRPLDCELYYQGFDRDPESTSARAGRPFMFTTTTTGLGITRLKSFVMAAPLCKAGYVPAGICCPFSSTAKRRVPSHINLASGCPSLQESQHAKFGGTLTQPFAEVLDLTRVVLTL